MCKAGSERGERVREEDSGTKFDEEYEEGTKEKTGNNVKS